MAPSIQLTAFPSLASNLSDLPGMQDIDPNLLHVSPFSHSGAASKTRLEMALRHTASTQRLLSPVYPNPPSSPSSDDFLTMKPTLQGPDHAVQGYHINKPITLNDNRVYHFQDYVRGSFSDGEGKPMCYARFECTADSSQHHPSTLIIPIHLRVATGVCSHIGCALKRGIVECLGGTFACRDDKH